MVNETIGGGKFVFIGIFSFSCLGLALLFPYNAIISATDWFEYALPNSTDIAGLMANANFIAAVITTFLILAFAAPKEVDEATPSNGANDRAPPIQRKSSLFEAFTKSITTSLGLHTRIYIGLALEAVPLLVFALIIPTSTVAAVLSFIVGIGDATAQSGIFPLAGGIHPRCTAAASLGSAIAGLAAGLLRLLTKSVFPETAAGQRLSSAVYFGIVVIVLAFCAASHYFIKKYKQHLRLAFFQIEYAISTNSFMLQSDAIKNSILVELGGATEQATEAAQAASVAEEDSSKEERKEDEVVGESFNFDDNEPTIEQRDGASSSRNKSKICHLFSVFVEGSLVYRDAFRCAWLPIIAQFFNFVITLSLFPAVVLSMQSSALGSWLPVILVTVFNAGDTLGRLVQLSEAVANWIVRPVGEKIVSKSGDHLGNRRPKMKYLVVVPLVLRLAFYPLIIFCINPLYIASDAGRFVIIFFFAISSGWIYSCCFMLGPELCRELKHKEATSLLLLVSTLLSLGIGSSMGLGIARAVVGESEPR